MNSPFDLDPDTGFDRAQAPTPKASSAVPCYTPTNREKSKKAKRGMHWCMNCDAQLVGQYGRCPNCGAYANRKKLKGV